MREIRLEEFRQNPLKSFNGTVSIDDFEISSKILTCVRKRLYNSLFEDPPYKHLPFIIWCRLSADIPTQMIFINFHRWSRTHYEWIWFVRFPVNKTYSPSRKFRIVIYYLKNIKIWKYVERKWEKRYEIKMTNANEK